MCWIYLKKNYFLYRDSDSNQNTQSYDEEHARQDNKIPETISRFTNR